MKKVFYKGRFFFIPVGVAAILSVISFVVMQLWNHLLPDIFDVSTITFWQAMGLFVLCKILFGFGKGGRGMGGGAPWMRKRMAERMKNMTPEERERFKEEMTNRMCDWRGRKFGYDKFNTERTATGTTATE
jgi:hypothetical protein